MNLMCVVGVDWSIGDGDDRTIGCGRFHVEWSRVERVASTWRNFRHQSSRVTCLRTLGRRDSNGGKKIAGRGAKWREEEW
jgi:hypothetical protein